MVESLKDSPPNQISHSESQDDDRRQFERHWLAERAAAAAPLRARERIFGPAALAAWLIVFAAGLVIYPDGLREEMRHPSGVLIWFVSWISFILSCPATNLLILACLASMLGAITSRSMTTAALDGIQTDDVRLPKARVRSKDLLLAFLHGFAVYITLLSGFLTLTNQPLWAMSIEQYIRLAGMVSLVSCVAGSDPWVLKEIWRRVRELFGRSSTNDGAATSHDTRVVSARIDGAAGHAAPGAPS